MGRGRKRQLTEEERKAHREEWQRKLREEYRTNEEYREKVKAKRRERYQKNPEYQKNYNKEHPAYCCEQTTKWRKNHRDEFNKYEAFYMSQHPELIANQKQKNKYKKAKGYTCEKCGYVGNSTTIDVHHIVPLSQGGTDTIGNLCCLCKSCHLQAHGKTKRN